MVEIDLGRELPDQLASSGVDRPHLVGVGGVVHHAVDDHRVGLEGHEVVALGGAPGQADLADVAGVDLTQHNRERIGTRGQLFVPCTPVE